MHKCHFRKTDKHSELRARAHIPVAAFKSFTGLEGMRWLAACWSFLATGFGRAAFSTVGCKGKGFEEGAESKLRAGFAVCGGWGASGKTSQQLLLQGGLSSSHCYPMLVSCPHQQPPHEQMFLSRLCCGQRKQQGWNCFGERLSVLLCLCPEGVLGQRRRRTKFPSWLCHRIGCVA